MAFANSPSQTKKGYITEEKSLIVSSSDEMNNKSLVQNVSVVGALRTLRRSKSAVNLATPGPRAMSSAMKNRATPLQGSVATSNQQTAHSSRSKYRTPMTGVRQKAISVDRMNTITPKVNPMRPFSMLRHARQGEAIFSMTGSPIVATS